MDELFKLPFNGDLSDPVALVELIVEKRLAVICESREEYFDLNDRIMRSGISSYHARPDEIYDSYEYKRAKDPERWGGGITINIDRGSRGNHMIGWCYADWYRAYGRLCIRYRDLFGTSVEAPSFDDLF